MSQAYNMIINASTTKATQWLLTSSGVFTDTQTITINGVVFTSVNSIGSTPGNFLIGADAAASLANLTALINDPLTTSSTQVALSAADAEKISDFLALSASTTATVMTVTSSRVESLTVSETQTNVAWSTAYVSDPIASQPAGKTSFQFIASGITSGNGVFTIQVSNDGTNWVDYNRLTTNVTNTNAQTDVRVASVTLNSNTSSVVTIPETDNFVAYRAKVVPTTDGSYSVVGFVA